MSGYGRSESGIKRKINQDAVFIENNTIGSLPNLYIVADGMGGHQAGEIASKMGIESLASFISINKEYQKPIDALCDAVHNANREIYEKSLADVKLSGMGTTLLAATIKDNDVNIVNVGDSRLYVLNINKKTINQITIDHSYVMELVLQGKITMKEAEKHPNKNIITRALGTSETIEIDRFVYKLDEDDTIMLCTDGLTNMLTNDEILEICGMYKDLNRLVDELIKKANEKGGIDNISVVLYHKNEEV